MLQRYFHILTVLCAMFLPAKTVSAQGIEAYLRKEVQRLRNENDSLRAALAELQHPTETTWDFLLNVDLDEDESEVFGASSVSRDVDLGHGDLMDLIRRAAPSVATYWHQSVDDQVSIYTVKRRRYLPKIFGRYERWYPYFASTFRKYGVPEDMIALCIVESAVSRRAVSPVGAAGIWQFMPATARQYGLRVDEYVDERFDVFKATDAAARYLRDAYKGFGRWDLTLMSYNCGSARVRQAIIRAGGSSNVWDIAEYLPKETRLYLPAFLAASYVYAERKNLGIPVSDQSTFQKTSSVKLDKDVRLADVARELECKEEVLIELNPKITKGIVPAGTSFLIPVQNK